MYMEDYYAKGLHACLANDLIVVKVGRPRLLAAPCKLYCEEWTNFIIGPVHEKLNLGVLIHGFDRYTHVGAVTEEKLPSARAEMGQIHLVNGFCTLVDDHEMARKRPQKVQQGIGSHLRWFHPASGRATRIDDASAEISEVKDASTDLKR